MSKIRILLADTRKLLREGMAALLERESDFKIVGEADEPQATVKVARAMSPDVAVLHFPLAVHATRDLIRQLRTAAPKMGVIALTLSPNSAYVREILEAGVLGCLAKECASGDLIRAIRSVVAGKVYLSSGIAEAVVSGYVLPSKKTALSARERETLQRIASGESTKQIAAAFGVSNKTVETHRRRIMDKLGVHSIAELTKYAVQHGLTSVDLQL
jgi:DNA-binding NarL/FixJ family response regulator